MPTIQIPKFEGFVLYDPVTELFSTGGIPNQWAARPKIWKSTGPLKNSFNGQAARFKYEYDRSSWERPNLTYILINTKYFRFKAINVVTNEEAFNVKEYLYDYANMKLNRPGYNKTYEIVEEYHD